MHAHRLVLAIAVAALTREPAAQSEVWTLHGAAAGDRFGWSIAALGDADGDGNMDFAVGAPEHDGLHVHCGRVVVISGGTQLPLWAAEGGTTDAYFGYAIAAAGDLDFDGRSDLIVGAPGDYAVLGAGSVHALSGASGAEIFAISSPSGAGRFGQAVAGGSDVDGDSLPDLLVGAPGDWADDGAAYVLNGIGGALIRRHGPAYLGNYEQCGYALTFVGDTTGDGRADYVIGGPSPALGSGFGKVRGFSGATGALRWTRSAPNACSEFGWSLAPIRDVSGNGIPDVLVGDRDHGALSCYGYGAVDVLDGFHGVPFASFTQSVSDTGLGMSLTAIGDIDGDGIPELAAGAPGSWSPIATDVHVWKLGATAPLLTIARGDSDDRFGQALAWGDANGDGLRDLLVGEPLDDDNGADSGTVHVVSLVRAPVAYCEAKRNSLGCTPTSFSTGTCSATMLAPFRVRASHVLSHKAGILFYGLAPQSTPFQGGQLCVVPPTRRTPLQESSGNAPPTDCSGLYAFDFNQRIRSGADPLLVAGEEVFAQYWTRDLGAASGTGLTDALAFYINP